MISFISSLYLPHAVMGAHDRSDKSFLYHKKEEYPMANVYDKLKEMNLTLPTPPAKGGLYTPVMEFGDHLLYCSGCGPQLNGTSIDGKLGQDLTEELDDALVVAGRAAAPAAAADAEKSEK